MGHRVRLTEFNLRTHQVSPFTSQTRPVMTSYTSFGFSKVAYVHDLPRHPQEPQIRTRNDIFCRRRRRRRSHARNFDSAPSLPSSLLTPKIITLQFYEPSCPT